MGNPELVAKGEIDRLLTAAGWSVQDVAHADLGAAAGVAIREFPLPVPAPPLLEQHSIVAELDRSLSIVRGVEAVIDANLRRAQLLRQAMLAKAFSPPEAARAAA